MLTSILHLTPTKKQSIYISGPLSNLEHKASETLTSQIILEASTLYSPAYYYRLLRLCDPKRFQKKNQALQLYIHVSYITFPSKSPQNNVVFTPEHVETRTFFVSLFVRETTNRSKCAKENRNAALMA